MVLILWFCHIFLRTIHLHSLYLVWASGKSYEEGHPIFHKLFSFLLKRLESNRVLKIPVFKWCYQIVLLQLTYHKKWNYHQWNFTWWTLISSWSNTLFTLSILTRQLLPKLVLIFETVHSTSRWCVYKVAVCIANSVDSDQTTRSVASDSGLHCLQRPICPNT